MKISWNRVVRISLLIRDEEGKVLESTEEEGEGGRHSLLYLHGTGFLLPAVEEALEGREAGDEIDLVLEPGRAFGYRDETMKRRVSPALFAESEIPLQIGETVMLDDEEGVEGVAPDDREGREWVVQEIGADYIILDGNNPWAGKTLSIRVRVLEVRAPGGRELWMGRAMTEEEMARAGAVSPGRRADGEGGAVVCGPGCEWC
ncbi:MAG: hypothetical protein P4L51_10305 [Puia sp.]|nr:hypothetical protein [Puia sp.]